jgi:hypothetical protein
LYIVLVFDNNKKTVENFVFMIAKWQVGHLHLYIVKKSDMFWPISCRLFRTPIEQLFFGQKNSNKFPRAPWKRASG